MLTYQREWGDPRNAVGLVARCAHLALPFYGGVRKLDLVTSIRIAEHYMAGAEISVDTATYAANTSYAAAAALLVFDTAAFAAALVAADASYAVAKAVTVAKTITVASSPSRGIRVIAYDAAHYAARAGVDRHEIQIIFARWVVRDLSGGRDLPAELRQAVGAAVVAGDEALAWELLS